MTVDELIESSEARDAEGQPVAPLAAVAAALGIPLADAMLWAWASRLQASPTRRTAMLTRAQAIALADDRDGRKALRSEVTRLRAEVRRWEGDARRRGEARDAYQAIRVRQHEELTRLQRGRKKL